jgi:flagellar hook-basal body complex protein FliE
MDLNRVSAISRPRLMDQLHASEATKTESSFGDILKGMVNRVSDSQDKAEVEVQKLLVGDAEDVHSVTVALAEAQTMMQLAVQVRDRVVEAYRELRQMPL